MPLTALLAHIAIIGGATVEADVVDHDLPDAPTTILMRVAAADSGTIQEANLLPLVATLDADPHAHAHTGLCIRHTVEWHAMEIVSEEWQIWVRWMLR